MNTSQLGHVGNGITLVLRGHQMGEFFDKLQCFPQLDFVITVEENTKKGMGGT